MRHSQGAAGGIFAQEVFERVRDVVGEALLVTLEQGAKVVVEAGGSDFPAQVGVFEQDAALAFRVNAGG